jgi:hypothetical protein
LTGGGIGIESPGGVIGVCGIGMEGAEPRGRMGFD